MLEERLNYLSIPNTENEFTKSLPYEEEVKEHAAKKKKKKKNIYIYIL